MYVTRRDEDDYALFTSSISGVTPLADRDRLPVLPGGAAYGEQPAATRRGARAARWDAPARSRADGFVVEYGERLGELDADRYVEGRARGVSHAQLHALRAGDIRPARRITLRGLTRDAATREVQTAIAAHARYCGKAGACVLIVHGRGKGSEGAPVLKPAIIDLLASARMAPWVRGFCTAQRRDGGTGALYVMVKTR